MHSTQLNRILTAILFSTLTVSALGACGSDEIDDTGFTHITCAENTIKSLASQLGVDEIVVYLESDQGMTPSSISLRDGASCEGTSDAVACKQARDDAFAEATRGELSNGRRTNAASEVVVIRKGTSVQLINTKSALKAQLGSLDTQAKALLWLRYQFDYGYSCALKLKKTAEGFEIIQRVSLSDCPITYEEQLLTLSADGSIQVKERGEKTKTNACAGRRPEGLAPASTEPFTCSYGAYLAHQGHFEAASVTAFHRMRDELASLGAPRELLDDCIKAADDEVRHADAMTRLAARFNTYIPEPCIAPMRVRSAEQIAIENMAEGCVRETYGALLAGVQAKRAGDVMLREAMAIIAREETEHAALSWRVNEFLMTTLGEQEREAVEQAKREAIEQLECELAHSPSKALMQQAGLPEATLALQLFTALREQLWA